MEQRNLSPVQPKGRMNPVESAFAVMSRGQKREYYREHQHRLAKRPLSMTKEDDSVMQGYTQVMGAWTSREFVATAWRVQNPSVLCRLSINRTRIDPVNGSFLGGISWDDLYRIKNECGYQEYDAVEIYPAEDKLVNVANLRHLWVMKDRIAFGLTG